MTYTKPLKCNECGGECNDELQCIYCGNIDKSFLQLIFPEKDIETCYMKIYNNLLDGNITKKEEEIFLYFLKHDMIQENNFADALIIVDKLQSKKIKISYETFKEIFKFTIVKFMKFAVNDKIKNYKPRCDILKLEKNIDGSAIDNIYVLIDEEVAKDFYNKGDIFTLITMYHEVQHIIQNTNIKLGVFNEELLPEIKEQLIRKYENKIYGTDTYYNNNYNNISYEVDARIKAVQYILNFLSYFGLKLSDSSIEDLKKNYIGDIDMVNRTILINGEKNKVLLMKFLIK